jgi:hypothetical protein
MKFKVNFIYVTIYIVLIICFILLSYAIIELITFATHLPPLSYIVRPAIDYIVGTKQPFMLPIQAIYWFVNLRILHYIYIIFLCFVIFVLVIILILWFIGLIIQKIIFYNPFSNMSPWQELNEVGFLRWFFDRTDLEKYKDTNEFVLDVIRSILTPNKDEAGETGQQKVKEPFRNKESITPTTITLPQPHKEYIDYDFSKFYITERKDDMFYTESFKSIRHREMANNYRNMTISRPDTVGEFRLPKIDIEEMIHLNKSYLFI